MRINVAMTKTLVTSKHKNIDCKIDINGARIDQVKDFRYLGSLITEDGRSSREIRTRIGMAKAPFWRHKGFLRRDVSKELKMKMLRCYVWSVFLYGCETCEFDKRIPKKY